MAETLHPSEVMNDFKTYPFFSGFSESLLFQICSMAKRKFYKEGDQILTQNMPNRMLIFLNSGAADVFVDGEIVSQLRQSGEVLGEMSVISQASASATIRACCPTECYEIDTKDFTLVAAKDRAHFQYLLYNVFSSILTERLRATNAKARQNEISNRDLIKVQKELQEFNGNLEKLIQQRTAELEKKAEELSLSYAQLEGQNAALTTGFSKLKEQSELRNLTLSKLKSLEQDLLPHLQKSLNLFQSETAKQEHKDLINSATNEVQAITDQLKSLSAIHQSQKELENRKVLLIEGEKKQQLIAKMALGGTGVGLDIASDEESAKAFIEGNTYDLVLSDISFDKVLLWAHEYNPKLPIAVITATHIEQDLQKLQQLGFVSHVVSRDVNDRNLTTKTIVTTINKILNQDFTGLEKYLSWGVDVHEVLVCKSSERADQIAEMQEKFKKIGVRGSLLDRCGTVAEEMLMNAIYDAPADAKGKPLFNHKSRSEEVELTPEQAARLRFACDGNLIAVSVVDPFGGLQKKIIFDYLQSCYQGQAGSLNAEKGGAGRGLHQIIENSDLTVFNVHSRHRTEVICLFYVDSARKDEGHHPSFHYFFF